MAATSVPGRSFVLHIAGPWRPVVVRDLATLRRTRVDSLDELPGVLRDYLKIREVSSRSRCSRQLRELTEAEERVASLATDGLANKEIAAALEVRLRTVETHLTSVYRKLGVQSRRELARVVREASG